MALLVLLSCSLGAIASCGVAGAKTERTYYTAERIAAAKQNLARYDWARKVKTRIFETGDAIRYYVGPQYTSARRFAAQSDEFLWLLQPTTRIPRVIDPYDTVASCPVCGDEIRKLNAWNPFRIDPIGHPYKVECPQCRRWFPSNDYHRGDLTSGEFADDGNGILRDGKRYFLLREYAHMAYGSVVVPTLSSLSQAYLLTDDPLYAHKGCVLLARLAMEYPNYGWDRSQPGLENRFDRTYLGPWNNRHPHYKGKQGGMITDLIWETFCLEATAYAYDALRPHMERDPALVAFVKSKGMPIEDGAGLRRYIETCIFRAAMRALQKGWIRGNVGFHEAAALAVALVMDDYGPTRPNSQDMVDFVYHGAGQDGYILANILAIDGGGHESPNYNATKLDFIRVARLMEEVRKRTGDRFPKETYPDLFDHPKARALFDYYIDILVNDDVYPSIGDCGGLSREVCRRTRRVYSGLTHENLYAVERYGDPRHARAATDERGELFTGELWEPYPETKIRRLLDLPESRIQRVPRLLDGYGVAILESGAWPNRRSVTLNYSSIIGHRQRDHLSLGLWARGVDLLPDLGYPRSWEYRWQWDANSLAHNTVTVDETQPEFGFGGMGRLFASANGVHVIVAQHDPYPEGVRLGRAEAPGVDLYERTVVVVDVDEGNSYIVDLFAVRGGQQHDQSWHAMPVRPQVPSLSWQSQATGTLAGPTVPPFGKWTDRWGRSRNDFPSYLTEVCRARLASPAFWTWQSGLSEGDSLGLHVVPLGGAAEVIMGRGRSPVWGKDEKLDYLLVRRQVDDGQASHFLTVLDPWQKRPVVQDVRVLSEKPVVIKVLRSGGEDEITLGLPDGPSRTTALRPLGVRVRSQSGGEWRRDVRLGNASGKGAGYYVSRIGAVDYQQNEIALPAVAGSEALVAGRTVRVHNADRSALFRIKQARREGGQVWLSLDQTAMVARGPVKKTTPDKLVLGTALPWAASSLDEKKMPKGQNAFSGVWLGVGGNARMVKAASRDGTLLLYPADPGRPPHLLPTAGSIVEIWQYGVGDSVELALLED